MPDVANKFVKFFDSKNDEFCLNFFQLVECGNVVC